ncbi:MAG: DUF1508 domain-containing protein [Treponema sp.]|nr:DUF1508 domain-containing protein [Treponema sp.]
MSKFIIKNAKNGVMFNLVASNGEVIATSEVYTTKTACKKGIASVQKNCTGQVENQTEKDCKKLSNPKFEVYKDKRGEFRFRLKATNGQIIAVGEGYKAMTNCMNGIKSIKTGAPSAQIVDTTKEDAAVKKTSTKKVPAKKAAAKKK